MKLVDVDKFIDDFPIRLNHYDEKNGSKKFVLGIELVLGSLECTPTVEAIPIEWIREWYTKHSPLIGGYVAYMLLDWQAENEHNKENTSSTY